MLNINKHGCCNNLGIGLLELLLSLALISILLLSAARYFATANHAQQVNEAVKMLGAITIACDGYQSMKGNYEGISVKALTDRDLLPRSFKDGTNINPWHGNITIDSDAGNSVEIIFNDVSSGDCQNLSDMAAKLSVRGRCLTTTSTSYIGTYPDAEG